MQKIPKIEQAESDLEAAQARLHEIDVASARVSQGCGEAEHLIGTLQAKLPALLSARAMGDDTVQDEIERIKAEIRRHEETLADAEPTHEGLKALRPPHTMAQLKARRLIERLEKLRVEYEELKEHLATTKEQAAPSIFVRLYELAAELELEDDWKGFIEGLQTSNVSSLSGLRRLIKYENDPDLREVAGRYKAIGALSIDVNHLSSGRQL